MKYMGSKNRIAKFVLMFANGSGIVAVGGFIELPLNIAQQFNISKRLKTCTSTPIATNPC
jgi:hypothetical protein